MYLHCSTTPLVRSLPAQPQNTVREGQIEQKLSHFWGKKEEKVTRVIL